MNGEGRFVSSSHCIALRHVTCAARNRNTDTHVCTHPKVAREITDTRKVSTHHARTLQPTRPHAMITASMVNELDRKLAAHVGHHWLPNTVIPAFISSVRAVSARYGAGVFDTRFALIGGYVSIPPVDFFPSPSSLDISYVSILFAICDTDIEHLYWSWTIDSQGIISVLRASERPQLRLLAQQVKTPNDDDHACHPDDSKARYQLCDQDHPTWIPVKKRMLVSSMDYHAVCWETGARLVTVTVPRPCYLPVPRCFYRLCPIRNWLCQKPKQCSGCHRVRYCSPACQLADWPAHILVCPRRTKQRPASSPLQVVTVEEELD